MCNERINEFLKINPSVLVVIHILTELLSIHLKNKDSKDR